MGEGEGREVRIAAVGDLHYDATRGTSFRDMFAEVNKKADVLVLCGLYGYEHAEAASMLGIAVGTCKAQLHRARGLLRDRLERGVQ